MPNEFVQLFRLFISVLARVAIGRAPLRKKAGLFCVTKRTLCDGQELFLNETERLSYRRTHKDLFFAGGVFARFDRE